MDRRKWFRRIGYGALGLAGFVALGGIAHARGFGGGWCGGGGHGGMLMNHLEDVLDDVKATPEQRQKITAIAERLREKGQALRQGKRDEHAQILAQWRDGALTSESARAHVAERAEGMKAFGNEVADAMVEIQGILTPDQRVQVAEKIQRRMERWGRHHGRGPGAPDDE